ncbi:MAG: hypothetical protein ACRD0K_28295 [Egibacteraceae bacterium]
MRDPSPELGDCEAFIGILHIACTDTYLKDAEAVGLAIRVEDSRVRRAK